MTIPLKNSVFKKWSSVDGIAILAGAMLPGSLVVQVGQTAFKQIITL
jgi:hypothetical protein